MGFFKKKKVKEEEKDKKAKKYSYRITVCDILGKSPREIGTFGANKYRNESGVVTLINPDNNFDEIFPLDNDYEVQETLDEVNSKLKYWQNYKPKPSENKLNKEEQIFKYRKLKKALETPTGSFLKIDKDGMPHLIYCRYRTSFIPLKWNLDFSSVETPAEPLIKNVLNTQLEKMQKYKQKVANAVTLMSIIWMVILLIWTALMGYWTYKFYDRVDESNFSQFQDRIDNTPLYCAELYTQAGENFLEASENAANITEDLRNLYNPVANIVVNSSSVR